MEKCPKCGAVLLPGALFCTECGTKLTEEQKTTQTQEQAQPQEQKTAPAQTPGAGVQEAAQIAGQQPVQPHFEDVSGDEDLPF